MIGSSIVILGQFVHPGLAWAGLALATIPIIIHILNRRRYRRMEWAAMEFLLAAHKRSAKRLRIEQFLLLALRCLIILLLGLGMARPFLSPGAALGLGQTRHHLVLLIDNSLSTSVPGVAAATTFEFIKNAALDLVDSLPSGDTVTVCPLASPAALALEGGSYDRQLAREQIEATQATFRGTDLSGGFRLTKETLQRSEIPSSNHAVIVFTDNLRAAWLGGPADGEQAESGSAIRQAAELALQSRMTIVQASPSIRDNLCIEEFAPEAHLVGTLLPTPLRLSISNHSKRPVRAARVQILLNGQIARELEVPALAPETSSVLRFRLQFEQAGEQKLQAILAGADSDALAADNRRYLTLDATDAARVLLVDGKPAARRFESQCGYLATALAPGVKRQAAHQIHPRLITDAELTTEVFSDYGLIALCNVRRLAAETWDRLKDFVERGGALVVFLGDNVLVEHYNRMGFAEGAGVLATSIGPRAMEDQLEPSAFVLLSRENLTHPVMADFANHAAGSLFLARTHQYYELAVPGRESPDAPAVRALMSFQNGDGAIVERLIGKGTSLLVATTANMDWTNLPAKGDFVSLMWNLVGYAWPRSGVERNFLVGEPLRHKLTAAQFSAGNEFVLPDGTRVAAEITPDGQGFSARLSRADQPGFYLHEVGAMTTTTACNVDPAESDLAPMSAAALREQIGGPFNLYVDEVPRVQPSSASAKRELGWNLLYLAFFLLLLEPLVATWFGRNR
ncbi:MAG: BatA domain-containing protein [Phycisphaerales bacterium]|nr:MAG: BatA domain-containing protein [Phycisphaerales bacterium]